VRVEDAWTNRLIVPLAGLEVAVLGHDDFIANKRASGRPKDLTDLALLDEEESAK